MTALKTVGVRTPSFANLQRYIEREGKWMGTRCLNVSDERAWAQEMDQTLALEGVAGRTKTRGYHMILAFNPDEVVPRTPDGRVDEGAFEYALGYGEEFARRAFPGCQVAIGAHLEACDADRTERVALHIVVSRAVLTEFDYPDREGHLARPGRLYDRNPSVARAQVGIVRDLDDQAGFAQLHRGRNVASHAARGSSREERAMRQRGSPPYKDAMRAALVESLAESRSLAELSQAMAGRGFGLDLIRSKANITVRDAEGHRARVSTLGVTREAVEARLRENAAAEIVAETRRRCEAARAHRPSPKLDEGRRHVPEVRSRVPESAAHVEEGRAHRREPGCLETASVAWRALEWLLGVLRSLARMASRATRSRARGGNADLERGWRQER